MKIAISGRTFSNKKCLKNAKTPEKANFFGRNVWWTIQDSKAEICSIIKSNLVQST